MEVKLVRVFGSPAPTDHVPALKRRKLISRVEKQQQQQPEADQKDDTWNSHKTFYAIHLV